MFGIFKQMTIRPHKKIAKVGEPVLPAHESKLRPLTQQEIHGKLGVKVINWVTKAKEKI